MMPLVTRQYLTPPAGAYKLIAQPTQQYAARAMIFQSGAFKPLRLDDYSR